MKIKERISRINLPARASMAYLGVSFIGKIIGILATPFFTRLISPEEYGSLILYLTILGGASIICSAISSGSAIYRCFKVFDEKSCDFLFSSLAISAGFSLIICILLFAFLPFTTLNRQLYLPLCLQIICDSIIGVSLSRARYRYRYGEVATISLISSALPVILSLAVIKRFGCGCGVRVYSMLIISIVIALVQILKILRFNGRFNGRMAGYMLKSSIPMLPHSISVAFSGQADKLFITWIMGTTALAKYSVAHSLGMALQFAITALGSALGPWLIRKLHSNEVKKASKVIFTAFILFCAASVGLSILSPEAMKILAPSDYLSALPAVIPIALSIPLSFLSYTVTVGLVHGEKGGYNALISIFGTIICLALNYTLIPKFGYTGAGFSILLSQFLQTLIGILLLRRANLSEMIRPKPIAIVFLITSLISFVAYGLYSELSLRVILLIIPALVFISALFRSKRLIIE